MPKGAVNAHVHLIGDDYPLSPNAVETPSAGALEEWLERYRSHLKRWAVRACDRSLDPLWNRQQHHARCGAAMGPGFTAVVLVPDDVTDAELDRLAAAGIRRFV